MLARSPFRRSPDRAPLSPSHRLAFATASVAWLLSTSLLAQQPLDPTEQWPQFRGPQATGEAPKANPPLTWSETENVAWKVSLPGPGSSTPIVWDGKVYLTCSIPTDERATDIPAPEAQPDRPFGIKFEDRIHEFVVLCYDLASGQELWRQVAHRGVPFQGHHPDNNFASGTPVTDGKRLYVPFGSQGYYAYTLDGQPVWSRDLGDVETRLSFGEGTSLTVAQDRVIVVRDHEGPSYIEVLDAATGETLWRKDRDEPTSWATPVVVERDGRSLVITNATNRVRCYDLADGNLIWEVGGQVTNVTPSPVVLGDTVYCASGYRGNILQAIPLGSSGDLTEQGGLTWTLDRGTPYIPSLLLTDGKLYFNQANQGIVSVVSAADGTTLVDRERVDEIATIYSSPVAAAGHVFFTGRDGTTVVFKVGDKLEKVGVNHVDNVVDASLVAVGDAMLLRGRDALYCFRQTR